MSEQPLSEQGLAGYCARPYPVITKDTAPYWAAAREHRLVLQQCAACGHLQHPPTAACARCGAASFASVPCTGRGRVFSFTVVHGLPSPPFNRPQVIGLIELAEGPRMVAELIDVPPTQARIGMAVELCWLDCYPDLSLPAFTAACPEPGSPGTGPGT